MDLERGYQKCEEVLTSLLDASASSEHQPYIHELLSEDRDGAKEVNDGQLLRRGAEIRNLLTSVILNLEHIQMEPDISAHEHREHLDVISNISSRIVVLLANPLSAGKHDKICRSEEGKE